MTTRINCTHNFQEAKAAGLPTPPACVGHPPHLYTCSVCVETYDNDDFDGTYGFGPHPVCPRCASRAFSDRSFRTQIELAQQFNLRHCDVVGWCRSKGLFTPTTIDGMRYVSQLMAYVERTSTPPASKQVGSR